MSNADIRGRFVWHELMTTDTKAASAFYPKVTAWKTQAWDKDPSYTLWVSGKGPFGGLRTLPDAERGGRPYWLPYIGTPDVDATLQAAQGLGARVLMGATEIPSAGRFAVLADPQGATFAIYGAPSGSQGDSGGSPGSDFSWHELTTSDAVAALRFYSELFGWAEVAKHDMGPMGVYHLVGMQGVASIGMFTSSPDKPMPTQWLCYAHVADVDKSANAAKAGGGKLVNGPMEVPGGTWIAHLIDPQGAVFAVHADKRVTAAAPTAQPAKAAAPKSPPAAPAAKPSPPTLSAPASASAATAAPAKPKSAPTVSASAPVAARSDKPAAAKTAPAPKPAAKKAPAKSAKKKAPAKEAAKKKVAKKKAAAKKRPQRKSKTAAKRATRKSSTKRKAVKKRGKKSGRRRSPPGGFTAAKRFAVKQADSLLKRLRGKKRR